MKKFEYNTIQSKSPLLALDGSTGWELITVVKSRQRKLFLLHETRNSCCEMKIVKSANKRARGTRAKG